VRNPFSAAREKTVEGVRGGRRPPAPDLLPAVAGASVVGAIKDTGMG